MRTVLMAGALALAIGVSATLSGCGWRHDADIGRLTAGDAALTAVYRAHKDRPLWFANGRLNERGRVVFETLSRAGDDGLDPKAYLPGGLRDERINGDPAVFDVALSRGLAAYAADLRHPTSKARFVYTDAALQPSEVRPGAMLNQAATGDAKAVLADVRHINPIYDGLREALVQRRKAGVVADHTERLILINMDRARGLPRSLGERYVWVDIPAARLTAFDSDKPQLQMDVVVGKPQMQTPMMVGQLRYAVVNPYWNIPEDLVRDSIAPKVMRSGDRYLKAENIELLSDWSAQARPLSATQVAWKDVASGATPLRARQRPGPSNMMGSMKIMSPNALGIYLHDTPHRDLFANAVRTFSSGCVRLSDAPALGRWLFGREVRNPGAAPETRVDLARPTPLYLTYFTAVPKAGGGIEERPDIYGLDKPDGAKVASARVTGDMSDHS